MNNEEIKKIFLSKLVVSNDKIVDGEPCWEWIGSTLKWGYGQVSINGLKGLAHRVSWIIFNGEIPNKLWVLHKCDNPKCVNPKHLFLGTSQDNVDDRNKKNRQASGDKVGTSKLSKEEVSEIKRLHSTGNYTQKELSEIYGVSGANISYIINKYVGK